MPELVTKFRYKMCKFLFLVVHSELSLEYYNGDATNEGAKFVKPLLFIIFMVMYSCTHAADY